MRPIKFRGKSKTMNRWLYGSLINNAFFASVDGSANHQILDTDYIDYDCFEDIGEQLSLLEVDPKSVGQYTGLKDSFKNDMYEGDILRVTFSWTGDERYGVIEWDNENNASYVFCEKGTSKMAISQIFDEDGDYIKEVIGNIYEDKHLLEGESNDQETSKEGTS